MPPESVSSPLAVLAGRGGRHRHRHIIAVVVDRDRRLQLIVGIDRDPADRPRSARRGRLRRYCRMIFCPSLTGGSPLLGAEGGDDAPIASFAAPLACSMSSISRRGALNEPLGGLRSRSGRLRLATLVTFSGIMRTSIESERRAGADIARRRIGERAEPDRPARLVRISSICGGKGRGALSPAGRRRGSIPRLAPALRPGSVRLERSGVARRQVARGERDFRVVLHRPGIGRRDRPARPRR